VSTVYSVGIYSGAYLVGSNLLYTVPTGKRLIVRDITAYLNPLGSGVPPNISFYDGLTTGIIAAWTQPFVQSGRLYHWEGRAALNEGEELWCNTNSGSGTWYGRVMGFLLTLP